jgi:hypothetical protein
MVNYSSFASKLNKINAKIEKMFDKAVDKNKFSDNWGAAAVKLGNETDDYVSERITDGTTWTAKTLQHIADTNYYCNGTEQTFIEDTIDKWSKLARTIK